MTEEWSSDTKRLTSSPLRKVYRLVGARKSLKLSPRAVVFPEELSARKSPAVGDFQSLRKLISSRRTQTDLISSKLIKENQSIFSRAFINEPQTYGAEGDRKFAGRINPVPEGHRGDHGESKGAKPRGRPRGQCPALRNSFICLPSQRGSILVVVLWSLFFLTALAVVINVLVSPQLVVAAKLRDRTVSRYLAQAGVKRAVIALRADETQTYDALNEPWSRDEKAFKDISLTDEGYFSLEYLLPAEGEGESQKRYGLRDEERRININTAPVNVLKLFFEVAAGVSAQDAAGIAGSVVDWRDTDQDLSEEGAEDLYYQALNPGYPCKDGRFEILEELLLVKGVTPAVFDKVKDRLTVFGEGKVNINTADALVLQGLGMSNALALKVVAYRNGGDGQEATEDDNVFQDTGSVTGALSGLSVSETDELNALIAGGLMTTRSDYFRGSSFGSLRQGEAAATIDFIVNREEEIVFWREK